MSYWCNDEMVVSVKIRNDSFRTRRVKANSVGYSGVVREHTDCKYHIDGVSIHGYDVDYCEAINQ